KVTSDSVSRVTRMLFVTSSYFVISTAPISLHFIVDSYVRPGSDDLTQAKLDMSFTVLYLFQFSHFVINFYCYTVTNKRFRRSVKKLKDEVKNRITRHGGLASDSHDVNSSAERSKNQSMDAVSKSHY
uniref:G-protein coupled receptors family 1 profile domain-containing protein n=3 Tax=Magallana TaxID=2171616 RepID=A0A8W8KR19_MAGGI